MERHFASVRRWIGWAAWALMMPALLSTGCSDDEDGADDASVDQRVEFTVTAPEEGALLATQRPIFSGTAEPGVLVQIFRESGSGSIQVGSVTADDRGRWSYVPAVNLPEGSFAIYVTDQVDIVDLEQTAIVRNITIDATPPPTPVLTSSRFVNTQSPTLTGTCEPGVTVHVRSSGVLLDSVTVDANGDWSVALDSLAEGTHYLTVTSQDEAGNICRNTLSVPLQVDLTAPTQPVIDAPALTRDTQPVIIGRADPSVTVLVYNDGTLVGSGTSGLDGFWSITLSEPLTEGPHDLTAVARDLAGNDSTASAIFTVTLDLTAPGAPLITSSAVLLSAPVLHGTAEPNSTVTVYQGDVAIGSGVTDAAGVWSAPITIALSETTYLLTATATDPAGNVSESSSAASVVADGTAPTTPGVPQVEGPLSRSQNVEFSWTASTDSGSGISHYVLTIRNGGGSVVFSGDVGNVTSYIYTGTNGQTLTATLHAVDGVGLTSPETAASGAITIDTTAPGRPGPIQDQGDYTSTSPLLFSWGSSTNAVDYQLVIWAATDPANPVLDQLVGNVTSYSWNSPVQGTTYFAKVAGVDGGGRVGLFTEPTDGIIFDATSPTPPGIPVDAGLVDVHDPDNAVRAEYVEFQWAEATDNEIGVSYYQIEVRTAAGGGTLVYNGTIAENPSSAIETLNLSTIMNGGNYLLDGFAFGTVLYARVTAYNPLGLSSAPSGWSDGVRMIADDDIYEENDTHTSAWNFTTADGLWLYDPAGSLSAGTELGIQADDDWYAIRVANDESLITAECTFTHAQGDIALSLYDAYGNPLASVDTAADQETLIHNVGIDGYRNGVFYLLVSGANAQNTYNLRWSRETPPDATFEVSNTGAMTFLLTLGDTQGSPNWPDPQYVTIDNLNSGTVGSALVWDVAVGVSWLSVVDSATDLTSGATSTETDTLRVELTSDASTLAFGSHSATITLSDPQSTNGPITIPVELQVLPVADIYEVDDTPGQAGAAMISGQTYYHSFHTTTDEDWHFIDLLAMSDLVISTGALSADTVLELYRHDGTPVDPSTDTPYAVNDDFADRQAKLVLYDVPAGDYYVRITEHNNEPVQTYSVTYSVGFGTVPPDPYEQDDTHDTATPISFPDYQWRTFHKDPESDYVSFTLAAPQDTVIWTTQGTSSPSYHVDTELILFRWNGTSWLELARDDDGGEGLYSRISVDSNYMLPGDYVVLVRSLGGLQGDYILRTSEGLMPPDSLEVDDPGSVPPANADMANAAELIPGTWYTRSFHSTNDVDWMYVDVTGTALTVQTIGVTGGDTLMDLYFDNGGTLQFIASNDDYNGAWPALSRQVSQVGRYYILLTNKNATTINSYRIMASLGLVDLSPDTYEVDDTAGQASDIVDRDVQARSLHYAGDEDWVRIDMAPYPDGVPLALWTEGEGDLQIDLYHEDQTTLLASATGVGASPHPVLVYYGTDEAVYYAVVTDEGGQPVRSYDLRMSTVAPDAYEANNDDTMTATTNVLDAGDGSSDYTLSQNHSLHVSDDADCLQVVFDTSNRDIRAYVENADPDVGLRLEISSTSGPVAIDTDEVTANDLPPGTYFIRVIQSAGVRVSSYDLNVITRPPNTLLPDLQVSISAVPSSFPSTQSAHFVVDVRNTGNVTYDSSKHGTLEVAVYPNRNDEPPANLDPGDSRLKKSANVVLEVGQMYQFTFEIPMGEGSYTAWAYADWRMMIDETVEDNNTGSVAYIVTP